MRSYLYSKEEVFSLSKLVLGSLYSIPVLSLLLLVSVNKAICSI